jgi:ABC-2 type transport system permease protein
MSRLARTCRLLGLFWSSSFAAELEYRGNFLVSALTSVGGLAGALFGLSLFYRAGVLLGGWTFHEALLVMGCFTALTGFSRTFLSPNLSRIVEHVQKGTLDFVLLKPIDTQLWLSSRRLSPWGIADVVLGLGIVGYAALRLDLAVSALLLGAVPLLAGATVLYSLWFLLATTTIWFVKIYNVTEVLNALLDAGRFPIDAFPRGLYRFVFTFVVPVAFLTTVPAQAMLGRASPTALLISCGLALALFAVCRAFFRFALRYYTSASS